MRHLATLVMIGLLVACGSEADVTEPAGNTNSDASPTMAAPVGQDATGAVDVASATATSEPEPFGSPQTGITPANDGARSTAEVEATWTVEASYREPIYYVASMPTPGLPDDLPPPVAPPELGEPIVWGRYGAAPGDFDRPHGVAVDGAGRVFVADTHNSRVQVFDATGALLGDLGTGPGDGPGQFRTPSDVCIDPDGNAYVADNALGRVQKFDATGTLLLEFGRPELLPSGTITWGDPTALSSPWTVACSIPGHVFVTDISGWRVVRYSADGVFELAFPADPVSIAPMVAVATTPDGRVLVSDLTNARIAIYDVEGNDLGTLLDAAGAGTAGFIPWSIEVGPDGVAYVSDIRHQRLLKLAPDGTLLGELRLADIGHGDYFVHGLAVAPDGALIVTQSTAGYDGATWPDDRTMDPDRIDRVVAWGPWP